jgi:hypothetical protein
VGTRKHGSCDFNSLKLRGFSTFVTFGSVVPPLSGISHPIVDLNLFLYGNVRKCLFYGHAMSLLTSSMKCIKRSHKGYDYVVDRYSVYGYQIS